MSTNPETLSTNERFQRLEQHMAETLQQLTEILKLMKQSNANAAPGERTDTPPVEDQLASFVSRRSMLKQAAMATLGAAAVLETMPSARATDDSALMVGEGNTSANTTNLTSSSEYGTTLIVANSGKGTGIEGSSTISSGVYGVSGSGYGVQGMSTAFNGLLGSASASGYAGVVGTSSGTGGVGVRGTGTYVGVYGESMEPITTSGSGYGLAGFGSRYGCSLQGALAPLYLVPNYRMVTDPNSDTYAHSAGEVFVDVNGGLWYCIAVGTPGTWRKLADGVTAGSFALLPEPTRFIDTRPASASYTGTGAPPAGSVGTFFYRFTGMNALAPYTPMGTTAPVIPFGATGLVGRITVLSGESGSAVGGQLKVSNVSPPGFGSGLVIWGTAPATQIVPFVLPLNTTSVSGSGVMYFENTSTHDAIDLVVDVTGYYY